MTKGIHIVNLKKQKKVYVTRPQKSTRPLVFILFTSKIRGRASQFFIMLVPPGKWDFQSQ